MFRKLFSAAALVSVAAAGLSFSARTQACPAPMPQTLLWLYKNSSEIHLARYAKSGDIAIESDEDEYSYVAVRHHFDVSSTLKGTTKKLVTFDETEYRSKRSDEVEEMIESEEEYESDDAERMEIEVKGDLSDMDEEGEEEEEYGGWRQPGETVLLFLKEKVEDNGEEGSAKHALTRREDKEPELVLTSFRDGVRHISTDDIAVFESRIKELNSIHTGDGRSLDKELVEWMIRCIEHHATRWDGAYELNGSFESLDRIEDAEEYEGDDDGKPFVWQSDEQEARFARLVTTAQMDRMSNILMSPDETPKNAIPAFMRNGESALIDLVERWAGADVAKFLLQRLRSGRVSQWESARLMTSIAIMLEDDELSEAAESYREIGYGDDSEVFEDDEAEAEKSDEDLDVEETESEPLPSDDAPEREDAEGEKPASEKPVRTYLEVRTERLAAFIALADAFLAKPEVELGLTLKTPSAGSEK